MITTIISTSFNKIIQYYSTFFNPGRQKGKFDGAV
nr:MAG TPA: alpha-S2-casein peptide [Caudoviricetes sp.]